MLTRKPSARKRKRGAVIAAIAVGSVIATWLLGDVKFFQLIHLKAGDLHFLVRGNKPTSNIVILAIDQKTMDSFRELRQLWHPYYAEAINAAAEGGAKVFMMDIVFGVDVSKYEKDHDQMLAEAVIVASGQMPVICANIASMNARAQDWPVAVNMTAAALGLAAFPNLTSDLDDFMRRQELVEAPEQGQFQRGFAFRVAEKFRGVEGKIENGQLTWQGRTIPRTIWINYAGPPGTFPSVSLADFIEAARAGNKEQIRKWVGGKAVLLGPDSPVEDRHPTPYYTAFSGNSWNTAGVEIHANTLRTLLDGDFLTPEPWGYRLLELLLVGTMTAVAAASLAAAQTAYVLLGEIALIALFTHLMFRANVLVSTSELLLTCLICVLASMVYRILTAETFGKVFQNAISIFVGKKFAATLSEEQNISLSGTRQLVTILFSDIRGFTAFCEEKDPALVVDLLNDTCALGAAFPKGFNAFYIMKYEISQGQYADFLNSLPTIVTTRFPGQYNVNRNTINNIGNPPSQYTASRGDRACNYLSWADAGAYLQWAALRPLSELEYEKACRGTNGPNIGEYAWGSSSGVQAANSGISGIEDGTETITTVGANFGGNASYNSGDGGNIQGPLRCGIFATASTTTRQQSGAGFYGVLDLSGNVDEYYVGISASLSGAISNGGISRGNGSLNSNGDLTMSNWPLISPGNTIVTRGGGLGVVPVSYNINTASSRSNARGGRGGR